VFLVEKAGLGTFGNKLNGIFGSLLYFMPALVGPFVDRYGFRKSLIACFSLFSLSYFAVGLAGMEMGTGLVQAIGPEVYCTLALILTAIGGSLIKPSVVGTVARTTTDETKSLGYSIYYTLVNLGGAVGPLIALQVREGAGIEYVLVTSAIVSVVNLVGTLLFYREPPHPSGEERRHLGRVLKDMVLVFTNVKFISFLVIFSGFWIMFWQIFYSLPFFVRDILGYEHFELIETVDAWMLIGLTVPITALTRRIPPIIAMALGFGIASAAWLLIEASPTLPATIAAVAIYAIGEGLQAPRFYEYVADLAPKDRVGTFMGFAFLPVAIGSLVAGPLSGYFVEHYVKTKSPAGMWTIVTCIGFASTFLMILYDRFVARRRTA
jgi:MFS family permease